MANKESGQIIDQMAGLGMGICCPDHVHMLTAVPPKYAVSEVIGFIKGKSAIHLTRVYSLDRGQRYFLRARSLQPPVIQTVISVLLISLPPALSR
jgi:hypothetical protein